MNAADSHNPGTPKLHHEPRGEVATSADGGITSLGTVCAFWKCGTCSEALMNVLDRAFGHPHPTDERGAMPLAGGIAQLGYQCGMLWGSALAAGAQAHERFGPGPRAQAAALGAARRLVESFRARNNSINCLEITDTDWTKKFQMLRNFLKGGPITCMRMSAAFAPTAFREIQRELAETPPACSPVSCAAELAKKAGLSPRQVGMAAGLAGGIGLSGGACGALGAAVWIIGMDCAADGLGYPAVNARASQTIERFLKHTDHEFECSTIVGRKFDGIDDHAGYLRDGGCSAIIEELALAVGPSPGRLSERLSA